MMGLNKLVDVSDALTTGLKNIGAAASAAVVNPIGPP